MLVRLPRPLRPACFLLGAGLIFYVGCSSSGASAPAVTHPTMIQVAPEDFLGEVPCATDGSGLKRYVATLVDRDFGAAGAGGTGGDASENEGGANGFQAPSSLPTQCLAAVGFGFVVPGRHYEVYVDGYDTDQLVPRVTGSREMVSTKTLEDEPEPPILKPRWRSKCVRAIGVAQTIVRAEQCEPFQATEGPGGVRVALGRILGDLECGSEPGQVDHLSVTLSARVEDAAETYSQTDIPCGADAEAVFEDLPARQRVSAYVSAFSADGSDAFAGSRCNAVTLPSASVDAECSLLSTLGTVRVDLGGALALLGIECRESDVTNVLVDVPGEKTAQSFPPPQCLLPFDHGFPAGPAVVTVAVTQPAGATPSTGSSLTCHADVAPGALVVAECEPNTDK